MSFYYVPIIRFEDIKKKHSFIRVPKAALCRSIEFSCLLFERVCANIIRKKLNKDDQNRPNKYTKPKLN